MTSTRSRAIIMNRSLPPVCLQKLLINQLAQLPPWRSAVNCVWAFSCFSFSSGCSASWEAVGPDSILPVRGTGAAGAGEEAFQPFLPEVSPLIEAEVFRVRVCEAEAAVVA